MKNKLLAPLFVVASFLLAGCSSSDIVARPSWMNDSIITNIITKDNTMKEIYDAIKKLGSTNSDLLNKTLYEIALKNIGNYKDDEHTKGLATFVHGTYSTSDIDAFISKYPIYKCKQEKGVVDGQEVSLDETQKRNISLSLMQETYKAIEDSVYEALYNEIKGGTYSYGVTKDFNEEEYVWNLYKNMNLRKDSEGKSITIDNINERLTNSNLPKLSKKLSDIHFTYRKNNKTFEQYVELTFDDSTPKKRVDGFLGVKLAASGTGLESTNYVFESYIYGPYIEKKIIPDIYRNLLIQNYVNEQRYSTLGRSYARKINEITVDAGSAAKSTKVEKLFRNFATDYICKKDVTTFPEFDLLEKCVKGYKISQGSTEATMLENAGYTQLKIINDDKTTIDAKLKVGDNTYVVYKDTKLGDLIEKLALVKNAPDPSKSVTPQEIDGDWSTSTYREKLTDQGKTAWKDLTNSNAYSLETGMQIKINEIEATSYTKDGWQLKSGMTDLSDTEKNRLFNISVSNIIDDSTKKQGGKEVFDENQDYARYFTYTDSGAPKKERAFLTPSKLEKEYKDEDCVVITNGNKVSIVEIEEAVSTSKLSTTSKNNYIHSKSGSSAAYSIIEMNKIIQGVSKVVSSGDTYKKNADQYYLMISNIIIHDTSVYNYFKQQFPDLFK